MTFHGTLLYQAVLVVFCSLRLYCSFYQCTNSPCSDEYLCYVALTEALQLLPTHSLDPLALLFHMDPGWDAARAWTPKQSTQPAASEPLLGHPF